MYNKILKEKFGFDKFKPIQEKAVKRILKKEDLLVILPTGSGKSLIYQLPSLLMSGTTIVISPLIALMQDQVASLQLNGINAKMINSSNTVKQNNQTLQELLNADIKLLYVAPERFVNENFLQLLQKIDINFFVIDEAHCVSEWGHEFRDDYRKLNLIKNRFANIPVTAFTATATKEVQKDILKTLQIKHTLRAETIRDNILIRCQKRMGNGYSQIISFLNTHKDECGIIYCFTRKETEKLSIFLNQKGFSTLSYHAGLPNKKRDEIFYKFKNEEIKIIVATIAFGMGIDKDNIRFVLHTSMPKTLENYFQEIGRAGRDSLKSDALLLYSKSDEINKRIFLEELAESNYKKNIYEKLNTMYRYCITSDCRHQFIAKYFGDQIEKCETNCDNCLEKDTEFLNIKIPAQKFLSAILRSGERFGANYIIDILKGSKSKRILELGHDKLSVYGIGNEFSKEQWGSIQDKLLDMEAIYQESEYKTLKVTNIGKKILKDELTVTIKKKDLQTDISFKEYKQEIKKDEIFEKLRELRSEFAKKDKIPAYMVFSDKTLFEISKKLPKDKKEFLEISGVGQTKLERYAKDFIQLCNNLKPIVKKPLHKTYQETLTLINKGESFDKICKARELKPVTILTHINTLVEKGYIDNKTKLKYTEPLKENFPKEIKEWIEKGLKIENFEKIREFLSFYGSLYAPK